MKKIVENLSDLETDDKSDITEEDVVIDDIKNDFDSDSDDEEDFNYLISYLQQKLGAKYRSDTAGTVEYENIEQEISAQNDEEQSANDNDVHKLKMRGKNRFKWSGKPGKNYF